VAISMPWSEGGRKRAGEAAQGSEQGDNVGIGEGSRTRSPCSMSGLASSSASAAGSSTSRSTAASATASRGLFTDCMKRRCCVPGSA
jgi:hypothetical protein